MRLPYATLCLSMFAALFNVAATAHEVRPAYLEIAASGASSYRITWKQPTMGEVALRLIPHLSNGWLDSPPSDQYASGGFLIRTWNIAGSYEQLAGATIAIEGLQHTITDVLVRIRHRNGQLQEEILRPETPQLAIADVSDSAGVPMFVLHGIDHILRGIDHLLFVLGLLLIVRGRWALLKAITAFTIAHSVTLAAAMLGQWSLPGPWVETMIALSILFLGREVLSAQRGGRSLTVRHPWAVAFFFGLFHGMGFAGGLTSLGFAAEDLFAALLFFNVGVEIGQLAFIVLVVALSRATTSLRLHVPQVQTASAYAVGIAGAYWTFQTTSFLLGVA